MSILHWTLLIRKRKQTSLTLKFFFDKSLSTDLNCCYQRTLLWCIRVSINRIKRVNLSQKIFLYMLDYFVLVGIFCQETRRPKLHLICSFLKRLLMLILIYSVIHKFCVLMFHLFTTLILRQTYVICWNLCWEAWCFIMALHVTGHELDRTSVVKSINDNRKVKTWMNYGSLLSPNGRGFNSIGFGIWSGEACWIFIPEARRLYQIPTILTLNDSLCTHNSF